MPNNNPQGHNQYTPSTSKRGDDRGHAKSAPSQQNTGKQAASSGGGGDKRGHPGERKR